MADLSVILNDILKLDGAMCGAVVDSSNGMILASAGAGVDIEIAAAGNSDVMRAKLKTMNLLSLNDKIVDILITLGKQYHVIRPVTKVDGVFIYLVLDSAKSNLALARRKVSDAEVLIDSI